MIVWQLSVFAEILSLQSWSLSVFHRIWSHYVTVSSSSRYPYKPVVAKHARSLKCDIVCYMCQKSINSLISHSVMVGASFWWCKIITAGLLTLSETLALCGYLWAVCFLSSCWNIYFLIRGYYIRKLSVQFFSVCAVILCFPSRTGWIIHLQADEKRAGKVRSTEVEWPWFLLAAGHPAVALVIIHTSQMAFPWASMKRTGQGLSCQVLPGPKNNSGPIVRALGACRKTLQSQVMKTCDQSCFCLAPSAGIFYPAFTDRTYL